MELLLVRHLWGIPESWEESFPRIRAAGYGAIEAALPAPEDRSRFGALLEGYGFRYIAQIFTSGASVGEHLESFRSQVEASRSLAPFLINSHSGQDAWREDQAWGFFQEALALEASLDFPVVHETHRGRILFNPWVTQRLLNEFEQLKLCCDFSHWVCVCERLLDGELEIIQQCARRCLHFHARVGYEEGPQVPDPRAPEYGPHLAAHEAWWQLIWEAQAARGQAASSLTPEYGPPGYLHTLPFTQAPVGDLWEICDWQARREAERFQALFGVK